jgi:2-keto-4-pentenoate hydratase
VGAPEATGVSAHLDHAAEARRIVDAHAARRTLAPISDRVALGLDDAYAIQALVTDARTARGERRVGWKLGYTSLAMREQMGVDAPNFGPLTDAMLVDDGAAVPPSMTQPRVEPEVALRFAEAVAPGADRTSVLAAVATAHACLEVVDSVWTGYRFTLEDNTADGSSAAGVVIGPELPLDRIADVEVTLLVDGTPVGTGQGSDASGHPADGVVWLVEQLAARGDHLRPGDVVITGGLTRAHELVPGSTVSATFDVGSHGTPVLPVTVAVTREP